MCLAKGVFVIVCLLLGVLGGLFVALSTTRRDKSLLLMMGCGAITASISGIVVLQHEVACGGGLVLY